MEYEKSYQDDKFGRILAYIFVVEDSAKIFVNGEIVRMGLAKVTIHEDRRKLLYQDQLLGREEQAKSLKINLWSAVN